MKFSVVFLIFPLLFSCKSGIKTYTDYYPDGTKRMEVNFMDGKLHGLYIMWFDNGQKQLEAHFLNDSIVERCVLWLPDGSKVNEIVFFSHLLSGETVQDKPRSILSAFERKVIHGWLKYEAEKLKAKINEQSLGYHRIKCLFFNTFV